jgi:spore coat polysaccharide biosynthesis protein SpsF
MNSTRLPGKVLLNINGRPMFSYMIERVRSARNIEQAIIATSVEPQDEAIVDFCKEENISCYRGSLEDVLDRYYQAATEFKCAVIIRLTADCPLIDPAIIDRMVDAYRSGRYDYLANSAPPEGRTYPDGMDVEVFSYQALKRAWENARKPSDREHVTFYFWKNAGMFSTFRHDLGVNWGQYRLTVDYPQDFDLVCSLITHLYKINPLFKMEDMIAFLDEYPDIKALNSNIIPNQGWQQALEKDKKAGFHVS